MIAAHCIPHHIFSIRSSLLLIKYIHTTRYYSYTYLCIIWAFIGHLLNVKNQDVCWHTNINPTYKWSLPSENSKGKPRKDTERRLGSKVATPWLSILHNSAITREATGMHFHPCFCVAVCGYDGLAPGDSRRGGHPHLVQPGQQQRGCWPPGAAFNSSQCILGCTSFLPGGQGNEVLLFWACTESHLSLCERR